MALGMWIVALAPTQSVAASDSAPEDVLAAKGLTKFGEYYVLEADLKLNDYVRAEEAAGRKYTDAKKRHENLDASVKNAAAVLQNIEAQNERQTNVLEHISKSATGTYNHQVDVVNAIRKKLREGIAEAEQMQKALDATPEPSDAEYVAEVVKLSDIMEHANRQYAALAADPQVKSALEKLKPPGRLGPSPRFVSQLATTRRLRDKVAPTGVRFDMIGGVPEVPVTINDSVKQDMVVESAAPYMCITQSTADKLGIQADASKQTVRVINSEGQAAEAKLVTLKTVQLGDFAVANVPCAIEPESMKGAKNILGKSILKHFVFRIDVPNGMLHLSQIDGAPLEAPTAH